ncbi:MAG: hypothetical protein OHK0044_17430 [Burkholderiaceae bacterium]
MTRSAKTLAEALAEMPAVAQLLSRLQGSQSVARMLAAASPPIGGGFDPLRPGVCELRGGLLLLTAISQAQAAKLRQEFPRMQTLLKKQGLELNEIRVRIQPALLPYREEASGAPQVFDAQEATRASSGPVLDFVAPLRFADELVLTLKDSPLRDAIERLRATLRADLTRNR